MPFNMAITRSSYKIMHCWVAVTIIASAAIYFFDLITNFIAAETYYHLEIKYSGQDIMGYKKKGSGPDAGRSYGYIGPDIMRYNGANGNWSGDFTGSFAAILSIMFAAHTLNAFIFWVNANSKIKREAVKSAYFLPLIHLRKLALLVWRTGTLQGIADLRSPELDAVYSIVAATLEAAPQLLLQFHTLVRLQYDSPSDPPFTTTLSVAASFFSGVYNYSQAVMYTTMKTARFARVAIFATAAIFSASALLTRFIGFEIMIELASYFNTLHALVYLAVATLPLGVVVWWDSGELDHGRTSKNIIKRHIHCIASIYMSIGFGPLYVLTNREKRYRNRKRAHWGRILGMSLAHVMPDVGIYLYLNQFPYQVSFHNDNKNHCGMFSNMYIDPAPTASPPPQPSFISCWTMSVFLMSGALTHIVSGICFIIVDMYSVVADEEKSELEAIGFKEWKRVKRGTRENQIFKYTMNYSCML